DMYVQDNEDWFMPSTSSLKENECPEWPRALIPYLLGPLLNLTCPEVSRASPAYSPDSLWNQPGYLPGCPQPGYAAALLFPAGLNYLAWSPVWWDCPQLRNGKQVSYPDNTVRPVLMAEVDQPAATVMFTDSGFDDNKLGYYLVDPPTAISTSGCYYW